MNGLIWCCVKILVVTDGVVMYVVFVFSCLMYWELTLFIECFVSIR